MARLTGNHLKFNPADSRQGLFLIPLQADNPAQTAGPAIRVGEVGAIRAANFPHFMVELCDLLDLPRPDPSTRDDSHNAYVFERAVPLPEGTVGRIDLYWRSCFVLEAKQGSDGSDPGAEALGAPRKTKKGTAVRGTSG